LEPSISATSSSLAARCLYRQAGFAIVDVTDKPIEESADEVIALVGRRLKNLDP
jgi:regulator of PEP synthase PpsR (kinase-PPPase family)